MKFLVETVDFIFLQIGFREWREEDYKKQSLGFIAFAYMVVPFIEMMMKTRDSFWLGVEIKHSVLEILNLRYLLCTQVDELSRQLNIGLWIVGEKSELEI